MAVITDLYAEDEVLFVVAVKPPKGKVVSMEDVVDGRFYLDKMKAWRKCSRLNQTVGQGHYCVAELQSTVWAQFNTKEDMTDPDYWED